MKVAFVRTKRTEYISAIALRFQKIRCRQILMVQGGHISQVYDRNVFHKPTIGSCFTSL